jgi:hypothetical protein
MSYSSIVIRCHFFDVSWTRPVAGTASSLRLQCAKAELLSHRRFVNRFAPANSFQCLTYEPASLLRKLDGVVAAVNKAWSSSWEGDLGIQVSTFTDADLVIGSTWTCGFDTKPLGPIKPMAKAIPIMIQIAISIWAKVECLCYPDSFDSTFICKILLLNIGMFNEWSGEYPDAAVKIEEHVSQSHIIQH